MGNIEDVRKAFLDIQDEHHQYFTDNKRDIFSYIEIYWHEPVLIDIVDKSLDANIIHEISQKFLLVD